MAPPSPPSGNSAAPHPLDQVYIPRQLVWSEAVKTALNQRHLAGYPPLTDEELGNLPSLPDECSICCHNFDLAIHPPHLMIFCCRAWVCETCTRHFSVSIGRSCPFCRRNLPRRTYGGISLLEAESRVMVEAATEETTVPADIGWEGGGQVVRSADWW